MEICKLIYVINVMNKYICEVISTENRFIENPWNLVHNHIEKK